MAINKESLQRRRNELQGDENMDFNIVEELNQETNVEAAVTEDTSMEVCVDEDGGVEATEADNKEFLINSKPVAAKNKSRSHLDCAGVLSMVNAKTGMRIVIAKVTYERLGQPEKVQFALTDNEVLIGKELDNDSDKFNVKNYKNKGVIYSASLVKEITEAFSLDYSDRTSITFAEARVIDDGVDEPILVVKLK